MNQSNLIYVIEDEEDIAELIRFNLALVGYDVKTFAAGEEGLEETLKNPPALLILDLMLPGMSGYKICQNLRDNPQTDSLPIVMVTAKGEERDIVKGLEMGADDYVTKPFSPKVLIARVESLLRRSKQDLKADSVLSLHGIQVHSGRHEVKVDDEKVDLTSSEFRILQFLIQRPGWVFTRTQIVDAIRGENYAVTDRSIDFQMVGLRKKLGQKGDFLETVRGVGYRFKELT